MCGNIFSAFWQLVMKVIQSLVCADVVAFVLFWNVDCGLFPKMKYCVSVEGNVVHVCEVSDGKRPLDVSGVLIIKLSGLVNCCLCCLRWLIALE